MKKDELKAIVNGAVQMAAESVINANKFGSPSEVSYAFGRVAEALVTRALADETSPAIQKALKE